jgi:hypothetical protein
MTTAEQWQERVDAWRASGQTADAFAAGKGFTGKTLRWWSCELGRRAREKPKSVVSTARPRIARVVRASTASTVAGGGGWLRVEVGSASVIVHRDFDAALLRAVVLALGGER